MKNLIGIWGVVLLLVVSACKSDSADDGPTFIAPVLTAPASGAVNVASKPVFKWNPSGENAVYTLKLSSDDGQTWIDVAEGLNTTTCSPTQRLAYNTTYKWKVAAVFNGEKKTSEEFSFTTIDVDTDGPEYMQPANAAQTGIRPTFEWEEMGEEYKYTLLLSEDGGLTWEAEVSEISETSFTLPLNLQRNRTYAWKVRYIISGEENDGEVFSFKTKNLPKPVLIAPENNAVLSAAPTLTWSMPQVDDDDQSTRVTFNVMVRQAGAAEWKIDVKGLTTTEYKCSAADVIGGEYEWQVVASDEFGGESPSATGKFNYPTYYNDGEYYFYNDLDGSKLPAGAKPFIIVITADGFVQTDYAKGGKSTFDKWADGALDGMFKGEPFKSYRNHFKVYKLVAISPESGITIEGQRTSDPRVPAQTRSTKFGTALPAGNSMAFKFLSGHGAGNISAWVQTKVPGITISPVNNTEILVLANTITRAACCWYIGHEKERSLSVLAINYDWVSLFIHELAGHGIGKLGDEYWSMSNTTGTPSQSAIDNLLAKRGDDIYSWHSNLDFSGDKTKAPWAKYYTPGNQYYKPDYNMGYYEGAFGEPKGAWRASYSSIMNSLGTPAERYSFNAIMREILVRRFMQVAGLPYSDADFLARDSDALYSFSSATAHGGEIGYGAAQPVHDDVRYED